MQKMRIITGITLLVIAVLMSTRTDAQDNRIWTLEDCVNYALENDPNIKLNQYTKKIQKNAVGIAKSNYFPTITSGTGYNFSNTNRI